MLADPKTPAEIEELKASWLKDPCWDLAEVEGFEAHRGELQTFQSDKEAEWAEARRKEKASENARLSDRATALGIPGGWMVVQMLERYERKITELEDKVEELENKVQEIENRRR